MPEIQRCFGSMGAQLKLIAEWAGAALDRLLDEGHASVVGEIVRLLLSCGWLVEMEVSFSDYGDRGSIDTLAWHPPSQTLLVVEVKSELGSIDGLLRPLDIKVRLAPKVARQRFGWRAASVSRLVVLPDDRTARRQVERHSAVFATAFPVRTHAVKRWLRTPAGQLSGLCF